MTVVLDQIDVWWMWFRRRVEGLTEDEYLWEPAAGCWSVRRRDDGRFSYDPWPDPFWPPPEPPPVTTIAWRMVHMIAGPTGRLVKYGFERAPDAPAPQYDGWPETPTFDPADVAGTPGAAMDALTNTFGRWRDACAAIADDRAWEALGDREGIDVMKLGENDPFLNVVQHVNREYIHHGAEIALLRDLYAARS